MTEETFEKADELMRKIKLQKRAIDSTCANQKASRLDIYVIFTEEGEEIKYIAKSELMHRILDLIYSAEREKLAKLEDEFKKL